MALHDHEEKRPGEQSSGRTPILERNIKALLERRIREQASASWQERAADAIARFAGSISFVYLHICIFGFWIVANVGWIPGLHRWDQSFSFLAMIASVEAIFLSTFVLITQNKMSAAADRQAELDLQISLLAEHEITETARVVLRIAERLEIRTTSEEELDQVTAKISPEKVLDQIDKANVGR
jgi:uncharacterized membrane protein